MRLEPGGNRKTGAVAMNKVVHILKEMAYMIKKDKLYFIAPLLILLSLLALLVYYIGPAVIVSFIYAGI